jgi:GxxExxY protein
MNRGIPDELNDLSHAVIGAAIEVHRELGAGFLESVYETALCHEMAVRGIPFERQASITVRYKDIVAGDARLDVFVDQRIIVELKAVEQVSPLHHAQVKNYLKATGCQLGLLINFNTDILSRSIKRIILTL